MAGLGVASFGHVNGVHMQNLDTWETYSAAIRAGEIPLSRAYRPTDEERMIRELVLQLKLGLDQARRTSSEKYEVEHPRALPRAARGAGRRGYLEAATDETSLSLTRQGLLRVDALLPRFFLPEHRRHPLHLAPAADAVHAPMPASRSLQVQRDSLDRRLDARTPVSARRRSTRGPASRHPS